MKHPIKAFSKAILLGTLAGGALPMCFTLPIAIGGYLKSSPGEPRLGPAIYLAGLPLWISFALVLASSIVVGLPAHLILRKTQRVSRTYYVSIGAIAGFLVPLAVLFAIEAVAGFWMALLGAFSGAITALSWSNSVVNNREPDKA